MINKFVNLLDSIYWSIETLMCTCFMRVSLLMHQIDSGKNVRFYGWTKFKKASSADIVIGANCTFRSKPTSNLIGINRPCIITALEPGARLEIGDNCGFSGTVIGCFSQIILRDQVKCGANTLITDSDWHPEDPRSGSPKPIVIDRNVWLGVNVTVLKGVTIGENSIIGAGSVVTRDIPANVIAAGNPCKIIRNL